ILGQNNRDFYPTANGNYAVITSSGGCTDTSACTQMTSVSIEEAPAAMQVSIFPNPSDQMANLVIYSGIASEKVKVYVIDMTGRVVMEQQIKVVEGKQIIEVPTANLAGGLYQVQLVNNNRVASTLKLVVNH